MGSYRAFRIKGNPGNDARVLQYWREIAPRLQLETPGVRMDRSAQPTPVDSLDVPPTASTNSDPPPICEQCQSTCNGSGQTTVRVWDPLWYLLVQTHTGLNWSRTQRPQGCFWMANGWKLCDPKNPTDLGTHWFTSACWNSPVSKADMYASHTGYGHYYNTDFGDPNAYTYANTSGGVEFNGSTTHPWSVSASGERWYFLWGDIWAASSNNCS
jgi:hypothetical protein